MLATIYEVDENIILDHNQNDDDSSKVPNQPSRLPYYICLSMITVCFLTLTLLIAISLNPFLLSNQPIHKNSKYIPIDFDDKSTLSRSIIKYLDIFSHQINEQLNLQPNTIKFLTSTISNSSLENSSDIIWIYSHLKYPQLCIDNIKCKEYFHLKLKKSFIKLSNSLTNIQINSSSRNQIQLDWCNLIKNSTTAVSISLVSVKSTNQSETTDYRIICENIDENIFLLETFDKIIQDSSHQNLTNMIDFKNNRNEYPIETNLICINPTDCLEYNKNNNDEMDRTMHPSNDFPPMWNAF